MRTKLVALDILPPDELSDWNPLINAPGTFVFYNFSKKHLLLLLPDITNGVIIPAFYCRVFRTPAECPIFYWIILGNDAQVAYIADTAYIEFYEEGEEPYAITSHSLR